MNILIIGKSGCRPCKDARKLARELVGKDGTYTYKDIEHADNEHLQHWMEVTGFLFFMFFAPETLRESLMH